jgi:8-oxo-dGTP pyrophosphatase MutT (NUDIX family)
VNKRRTTREQAALMGNLDIDSDLRDHIANNLRTLEVQAIPAEARRHAAVALVIVDRRENAAFGHISFTPGDSQQAAIILTIRSESLKDHGGQRAFPGGRIDPGENAEQAALRELHEELGLILPADNILGRLDDYATRSGFVITPVVIWGGKVEILRPNPAEVASVHRIPLSELLREDAPILQYKKKQTHPVLKMPLGDDWIAAPTAALAYQFREVALLGIPTRVAHFDQPRFAWS